MAATPEFVSVARRVGDQPAGQRTFYRALIVAMAILVAVNLWVAIAKAAELCPANHRLQAGVCIEPATGVTAQPQTAGDAYDRFKSTERETLLCSAWDLHVTSAISELSDLEGTSQAKLSNAGLMQVFARELCREGRYAGAFRVYEAIALDVQTGANSDEPSSRLAGRSRP